MNRRGVLLATCALAGCVDRTDDTPLFGGEAVDRDALVADIGDFAIETHVIETPTLAAAPLPGDRDGDFLADEVDTCPDVEDSSNVDTDLDGVGNACDADYDNDGLVAGSDYSVFVAAFGGTRGDAGYDARADHDHNGTITGTDFATFTRYFNRPAASANTIAIENVAAGDELVAVARFTAGTTTGTQVIRRTVSSVVRDAGGRVATILVGTSRLVRWSPEAWVYEGMPIILSGSVFTSCPRVIALPARPLGSLSQFCSSTTYQSLALAIRRP